MQMAPWPEDFPTECPPPDATAPEGGMCAYRGVHHNPPQISDFVPLAHEDREHYWDNCPAHGLSLFKTLEDIPEVRGPRRGNRELTPAPHPWGAGGVPGE